MMKSIFQALFFDKKQATDPKNATKIKYFLYNKLTNGEITLKEYLQLIKSI
ncbi:MAG: hypothetical protein WKF89_02900 [Chitinophagaceae bacterium]